MKFGTCRFKTPGRARAAGFTLIEVVMSTSVLALAITGAIAAIQVGFRELELSRATAVVTQVMQSEAERLRLQNWSAIQTLPEEEDVDLATAITDETLALGNLRLVRRIEDVTGFSNMKEILLRASWTSIDGRSHSRVILLRYAKGGLFDYYYGS